MRILVYFKNELLIHKFIYCLAEEIMHQILSDKAYLAENVIMPFDTSGIQEKVKQTIEKQQTLLN